MMSATAQEAVNFSLFEGDSLHRVYAMLGVSNTARHRLLKRAAILVFSTWVPMALLAPLQGLNHGGLVASNFFADFAAYVQFLIAVPLFLLAEPIADSSTRVAARQFIACGIIGGDNAARLYEVHGRLQRLRKSRWPDAVCLALAYFFSLVILVPEFRPHPLPTWHILDYAHWRTFSLAGAWAFLVALPILNYLWLRFIWKILLWIDYLRQVSRMRLDLHPTHPDLTGGIGFISEAQSRFAVFILGYGISNVAASVGYEITILHYDITTLPVWGPLAGFSIGAPLLFTLPLFMFTRQLFRAKRRALAIYRRRVTEHSRQVESRWFAHARIEQSAAEEIRELTELTTLGTMFSRIEHMRVVPFDLKSFGQLVGSSVGSIATLLPLLHVNGEVSGVFDVIAKLLGHFGSP